MTSGNDERFEINRPLNLTTKVEDTFKKVSIRQNGLQPSNTLRNAPQGYHVRQEINSSTGWRTKCHTIDCAHNTFLLLHKHLTSGTELILIGWKIVPNEEHVQCDHRFASQPIANEPLHSSQLFDTSLLCFKACSVANATERAINYIKKKASFGGQKM